MKKRTGIIIFLLLVSALSMLALTGCGQKAVGNTIPEPEITTDYLEDEYAQQLITDGAEIIQGTVTLEGADNSYAVHISEKEVVPNEDSEEGYYVADTNVTKDVSLGFDARLIVEDDGEFIPSTPDAFMEIYPEASEDYLFTIYLMGDSAELIIPAEPSSLIQE